jgi:CHASE3 domain sensor protein
LRFRSLVGQAAGWKTPFCWLRAAAERGVRPAESNPSAIPGEIVAFANRVNFAEATKERITLLRTGIGLLILVIAAISWAGYRMLEDFRASGRSLLHAYEVRESLERTLALVQQVETGTRDFLLTRDVQAMDRFNESSVGLLEHLQVVRGLTHPVPAQEANVARLEELCQGLIAGAKRSLEHRGRSLSAALRLFQADAQCLGEEIRDLMHEMKAHEQELLTARQKDASGRVRWNAASCGLVLAADLAVLGWIATLSLRLNRLHRVIRVCAWTKQVEHEGKWITLEEYLQAMLDAPVTHGICAEAAADLVAASSDGSQSRAVAEAER